ncbi:MAG TPA: zinc finger Ran-binding domain-containing protein [Gemmatimonadales bacterium]|nr:zinc finger Ran-binding domain-containing protein [Gemmatimonadales bacterium]
MAKPTSDTETIESLLEQRAQYEQWLAKLDSAANKAPAAVRQKVRGDYETRLRGVIDRLRGHAATITGELERHQGSQAELDSRRRDAEEELAEAEVRYAVGEYTEEEWSRISQQSESRLQELRDQLRSVGGEIARLSEVQALITGPSRPAEPRPEPAPQVEAMIERNPPPPPPPPPAPEPVAAAPPRQAPKAAPAPAPVDELAFLKSVADDELRPAARRPSNPGMSQPAPQAQRAAEAPPAPAPSAAPAATAPAPAPSGAKSGSPGVAKTLKCGECGTLNRPTEWYCERCGAELAGI